jgi:hypothetical protein
LDFLPSQSELTGRNASRSQDESLRKSIFDGVTVAAATPSRVLRHAGHSDDRAGNVILDIDSPSDFVVARELGERARLSNLAANRLARLPTIRSRDDNRKKNASHCVWSMELFSGCRVVRATHRKLMPQLQEGQMGFGRGALLWILGIPLPIILLLALFWHH